MRAKSRRPASPPLKRLLRELDVSDSGITEAQRTLADAQTTVTQLTKKKQMLEEIRNEISVGRAVIDGQRDLLASQRADIDAVLRVRTAANGASRYRAGIEAMIKAADARVAALRKRVASLARKVAAADRAAAGAAHVAAAREARYRASQEQLRELPSQITTLHARIAGLSAAGKAAVDAGRVPEAFVAASDLGRALGVWKRLTERGQEERLVTRLMKEWESLDTARETAASKAAAVDGLRRELTELERELDARTAGRDAEIKAKLPAIARRGRPARAKRPAARVPRRRGGRSTPKRRAR